MIYKLNITQKLIDGTSCPITSAIESQTPFGAHVGINKITLWKNEWIGTREIPITYARALDFIARWDGDKSVKPFVFNIEVLR